MKKTLKIVCSIALLSIVSMMLFGATLSAYIDPSVVTYLIQAVAGVVIAVGAVVGVLWRRAKKKAAAVLNIDENKNKDVESDDIDLAEENEEEKK